MPDIQIPVDAWVEEEHPAANHGASNVLSLSNIASKRRNVYLYIKPPFEIGDTIRSPAILKLNTYGAWAGQQITAKRVTGLWIEDKVTWATKPTVDATHSASATKTGTGEIDLDLTAMMGDVAAGGDYIGIELSVNGSANLWLCSAQFPDETLRPLLAIEWSLPLDVPTNLEPTGGMAVSNPKPLMNWDYGTDDEVRTQSQSWVQVSTDPTFATTVYDSGWQANTQSDWDLSLTAFGGLSTGTTYYHRVQVKDDTGRESGWSDPHEFVYEPLGTTDITYPDAATTDPANGDPYVDDLTPEIEHAAVTGATQDSVEVVLVKVGEQDPDESDDVLPADPDEDPEPDPMFLDASDDEGLDGTDVETDPPEVIWTYPKSPTAATSVQVDPDLLDSAGIYEIQHRVYDQPAAADRLELTNAPAHIETIRQFRYKRHGGPTPVTDLEVTKVGPGALLTWTYPTGLVINYFALRIDGRERKHRIELGDVRVGTSNTFQMYVWDLTPFQRHRIVIEAVDTETVRGKLRHVHSTGNKRRYVTPKPVGIYLIDPQQDLMVKIRGTDTPDLSFREVATTYDIIGGEIPQRVIDMLGGYQGSVSGFVLGQAARNRFKRLKKRSTRHNLRLAFSDLNFPIRLEETSLAPSSEIPPGTRKYECSFSFFQAGEVTWKKGSH
jgi:hypothetical protein